jgi:hypothetical protein
MAKENIFVPAEKDFTGPAAKKAQHLIKGQNPDLWSDGETRLIGDLNSFNYSVHFCLSTGEILIVKENIPVPRICEIVKLIFPAGSLEQKFLAKLFKVEAKITKYEVQAFHFKVTLVESEIVYRENEWPGYTIIMEPIEHYKEFETTLLQE